jgi:hypothetical protein
VLPFEAVVPQVVSLQKNHYTLKVVFSAMEFAWRAVGEIAVFGDSTPAGLRFTDLLLRPW